MKSEPRIRVRVGLMLRTAAITTVLGLLIAQTSNPQQIEPPRIGFEFRCPTYVLAGGQTMTLLADVFGAREILGGERAKLIAYRWQVCGGKIISGQGTPKVTIDPELPSSGVGFISVKILLDGGPPELAKEKSCTLKVDPGCAPPALFDQYQDISPGDEQQHLDRLGKYLTSEGSTSTAFVVAYAGRRSCFWEAEWRAARAKKYLVDIHKVDASRIITVDGGFRDNLTMDLFMSGHARCGPFPTPNVVGSSAYVNGSCNDKYKGSVN